MTRTSSSSSPWLSASMTRRRDWWSFRRVKVGLFSNRNVNCSLDNLVLLDYQPYESLPDVLASADVLVAVLEPDAGRFSVPSKVLNYLCAGRPVLGVMPVENEAAATLLTSGAGVVVDYHDDYRDASLSSLRRNRGLRWVRLGALRRRTFDIAAIAARFESVLCEAVESDPIIGLWPAIADEGRKDVSGGAVDAVVAGGGGFIGGHLVQDSCVRD